MMSISRPAVHPIEAPPLTDGLAAAAGGAGAGAGAGAVANNNDNNNNNNNNNLPWMKDIQGMPGTPGGLVLRFSQFMFAVAALCVMVTTNDFTSVTAFCYLVAVVILQITWSLSLAFVDIYALLVGRCLRNPRVVCLFTIGDGITSTLTFAAACASAGITVLIGNDIGNCAVNHCTKFETATAMAFLSWFAVSPSFLLNFWSLASR